MKRHRKKRKPDIVEVDMGKLEELLERVKDLLSEEDYELLRNLVDSYVFMTGLVEDEKTTIAHLRKLLFGAKTEKTRKVCPKETKAEGRAVAEEGASGPADPGASSAQEDKKRKGHGRNGAEAYKGAKRKQVCHETLEPGDICPECQKGKVYEQAEPRRLVRVVGQAPVTATVYELQRLRCNLCGRVFTAKPPPGVGEVKYGATVASMIALMKYGSGLPFNRLDRLEGNLGIPLPAATQWDIVHRASDQIEPVHEELIRQAAQGEVLHNDDTGMKILEPMGDRDQDGDRDLDALCADEEKGSERRSVFTSGIVSIGEGRRIALFFTGTRHAGERLGEVLAARAAELGAPIQMCDALSRNVPKDFQVILANCLAHGRRKFVDVAGSLPAECRHVLESLAEVYGIDARAREESLSPQERLELHQSESAPLMEKLKTWFEKQVDERKVEPNSGLGQAIAYMLKHWKELTLFLREAGAPLDNNICERALKKAILHRKNALFYKTRNGARVGDMYMSLIYTAELSKVSAFDYLTALQRNAKDVKANPAAWMPWNYQETLGRAGKAEA